jgi:hypothetical protein
MFNGMYGTVQVAIEWSFLNNRMIVQKSISRNQKKTDDTCFPNIYLYISITCVPIQNN